MLTDVFLRPCSDLTDHLSEALWGRVDVVEAEAHVPGL